jgi:hypothetical protein
MEKNRSKLAGCIIQKKDFNTFSLITDFSLENRICQTIYYYTSQNRYKKNYKKTLEWIENEWINYIIIDGECWDRFGIRYQAYISHKSSKFNTKVYCINKTKIQKIPLDLLLYPLELIKQLECEINLLYR